MWCLIGVTLLNMDTGPWETFHWFSTLRESVAQYTTIAKSSCPILRGSSTDILEDLALDVGDDMEVEIDCMADGVERELHRSLHFAVMRKFPKVGMCRWFQFVKHVRELLRLWTMRWVIITYYLITLGQRTLQHAGLLAGAAAHLKERDEEDDIEAGVSTKMDREEVQKIRTAAKNNLGFCHTMLSFRKLWRALLAVCTVCGHAERFERQHTAANRSASESATWWSERAGDKGFEHIGEIFGELSDPNLLMQMGCHFEGCSVFWLNRGFAPSVRGAILHTATYGAVASFPLRCVSL